jgi:hypothetical protein
MVPENNVGCAIWIESNWRHRRVREVVNLLVLLRQMFRDRS